MSFWVFHFERFGEKTTNHARSRNSSVALKPSVCEKRISCSTRKSSRRSKKRSDKENMQKAKYFGRRLIFKYRFCGLSCFVWFQSTVGFNLRFVSPRRCFDSLPCPGWFQSTVCFSTRMFRRPALPPPFRPPLLGGESKSASNFVSFVRLD